MVNMPGSCLYRLLLCCHNGNCFGKVFEGEHTFILCMMDSRPASMLPYLALTTALSCFYVNVKLCEVHAYGLMKQHSWLS